MKIISIFNNCPDAQQKEIFYYTIPNESVPFCDQQWNLRKKSLIPASKIFCLNILRENAFHNDGYTDLLEVYITGCVGNCYGHTYQIIFCNGGKFRQTSTIGFDFDGIEIIKLRQSKFECVMNEIWKALVTLLNTYHLKTFCC